MVARRVPRRVETHRVSGCYVIYLDGEEIARREALIWVRLDAPGIYLVCGEDDGDGILVDGEIYHVRGGRSLPGKRTVTLDYIEE